jgi:FkbM family methyltransferase
LHRECPAAAPAPAEEGVGSLWRVFDRVGMKLLDIGARGGSLPWLEFFAPFTTYFGCEPDAAAAAGLSLLLQQKNPWRGCVIISEAMGTKSGPATLYLTRHPGLSSVLKPNIDVVRDFGLEDEFVIEDTIDVPMITMEAAAEKYGFGDVGFVKLDTQGSELDILKSGAALLADSVQGVFVEVEFRQFYQRQPLFSEVEKFLRRAGFELIGLDSVTRRRTTTGLRLGYSRRELTWAHALFIKKRPHPGGADEQTLFERLVRQIAIAIASEHFDLAAERLVHADCAPILRNAGLSVTVEDLDAYVQQRVSMTLYRDFRKNWSGILKDRSKFYT